MSLLEVEQELLDLEPRHVTDQVPIRADDAMARNDDRKRILVIRATYRTHGLGLSQHLRDLLVAARFTIRDALERAPHVLLEGGALQVERKIEFSPLSREIFLYLIGSFVRERRGRVSTS